MKTTKVAGLLLILLAAAYFVYPNQTGHIFDQVTTRGHEVDCDILINRELGNPYIKTVSCFSGPACDGFNSLDVVGDYRGNLEMNVAGNTRRTSFTVGLGLPLAPANTQIRMTSCAKDGSYDGVIRLYDGQAVSILDTKTFHVEVHP